MLIQLLFNLQIAVSFLILMALALTAHAYDDTEDFQESSQLTESAPITGRDECVEQRKLEMPSGDSGN